MLDMHTNAWLRRGSSIVFDRSSLGPLIDGGALVSLREILGWTDTWPSEPPGDGQTVLVCGIETILQVMEPSEAENFLRTRIRPFVREFQTLWDQRGLVFGFGTHESSFQIATSNEEVLFIRRDSKQVRLSHSLWDGSATMNMMRLVPGDQRERSTSGYHVARIS